MRAVLVQIESLERRVRFTPSVLAVLVVARALLEVAAAIRSVADAIDGQTAAGSRR